MAERILAGKHLLQGDEACAEGALAAGCKLFAGYPISPATEVSERLSWRLPQVGGVFCQGADELDSLTIAIGAAWGGWKAMTATSGNGICLMQENIGYAAMSETPVVIADVQRAGPGTGIATKSMQADFYQVRYGSNADYAIIALAPESPQETFDLTVEAFNLAEEYRTPVFVMLDEIVGHMREQVIIPQEVRLVSRKKPAVPPDRFIPLRVPEGNGAVPVPPMPAFGDGYRMPVSSFARTETGAPSTGYEAQKKLVERLVRKVEGDVERLTRAEDAYLEDAEVVVVSYGSVARSMKRAVALAREQGLRVGYSRLITLWPFPDPYIKKVAASARAILVPEMSVGKLCREVERAAGGKAEVSVFSKPGVSLHTPGEILAEIKRLT